MRYALTYSTSRGFQSTDTVIVEDGRESGEATATPWYEDEEAIADILNSYGVDEGDIEQVIEDRLYYVRNCEDVDVFTH